jgi:hypothetical protein
MMENLGWILMPTDPIFSCTCQLPLPALDWHRRGVSVYRFAVRDVLFDESEKDQLFIIDSNTDYDLTKMIAVWMHKINSPVFNFSKSITIKHLKQRAVKNNEMGMMKK